MPRRSVFRAGLAAMAAVGLLACGGGAPPSAGLRDSFLQQLAANRFITDVQTSAEEVRFRGPGVDGKERSEWRVHVDSADVEKADDTARPFKGVVRSSWYADGQLVRMGSTASNLPIELTSNGLAQECWAFWEASASRWSWE
jgi:hypothetical protein